MHRISSLGLAALLSLAAPAAMASSTATASLNNLQLWVFDLTPLDGITPTFTLTTQLSDGSYVFATLETGENDYLSGGTNLSVGVSSAIASAGATLVGGVNLSDFSFSSSASSQGSVQVNSTDAYAYSGLSFGVQFSTDALLVITADGAVAAASPLVAGASSSAYSYVQISNWQNQSSIYSQGNISAYVGQWSTNDSAALMGTISASLLNNSGADMNVWINGYAQSYVEAAPVPEPGSYAMLMAGLLAVGAVARRRR